MTAASGSTSGRRRARRGSLTRDRIVRAALELVDAGGVESLSMPKLADHLEVGVMSLYTHVASKDDLLDAITNEVLRGLPSPAGGDWRTRLAGHFRDLRAALVRHPGLGMVLATKNVAVPAVFEHLEQRLADLTAAGLGDEEAAHLYYDLLAYTLGFVAWELPRTRAMSADEYGRRWRAAVDELDGEQFPTVRRLVDALTTVASDEQFEGGLRRIIPGIDGTGTTGPERRDRDRRDGNDGTGNDG